MKYKVLIVLIFIFGLLGFLLYQNGLIGSHTFKELFTKEIHNSYNGEYTYDFSKINNPRILKSIEIGKQRDDDFVLRINNSGASLFGYQHDAKVRNRFFTVCLKEDGSFVMSNGDLGTYNFDYCTIPNGNQFKLEFESISKDRLYCTNCKEQEFPSYWVKY
jgi:hypothetical protein